MKLTKSIVSVVLACMLVFAAVIPALASDITVTLEPSADTVAVGDTIVISVKFAADDTRMNAGKLPIIYDPAVVSYVEKSAEFEGSGMFVAEVPVAGKIRNSFCYQSTHGAGVAEGVIYTAEFTAVAEGTAKFSIDESAYMYAGAAEYALIVADCEVTVDNSPKPPVEDWWMVADLNRDGIINLAQDLNYYWEAYWHMQGEEFGFRINCDIEDLCARADFNSDGKINLAQDLNYFWKCYWAYQEALA